MMNKNRIEALSDGVFAIVMTLLVIELKVPSLLDPSSSHELIDELLNIWPLFRSYYISFAILGMYWISHHTLFHLFAKHADRAITHLNILFLCFIALIPFSTHLIAKYPVNVVAIAVYGGNIIVIGAVQYWMLRVTISNHHIVHEAVTPKLILQSKILLLSPPIFALLGIIVGFYYPMISFFFFAFPVIFNIIPSSLILFEQILFEKNKNSV